MPKQLSRHELRAMLMSGFKAMATAAEQAIAAAIASGRLPEYRHLFTRKVVTRVVARRGLRWRYEDFIRDFSLITTDVFLYHVIRIGLPAR